MDRKREIGPLKKAPDALVIDSTNLKLSQVIEKMIESMRRRLVRMFYNFCRSLFRFFFTVFCHWKVKGLENIPDKGPVLIIANHISYWDPVVVACAMSRKVQFMAKAELFNYPVFGFLI